MRYKIGLDIGITSVGWAAIMLNAEDEPCKILDMGVRIFDAAEQPKTGESLALPRRMSRGARRRLRRQKHRILRIKYLLENLKIITQEEIENLFEAANFKMDIYQIRYEGLDRLLDRDEFVRLLLHLAQRRGFKSNRKVDSDDKKSESGLLTTAVADNAKLLQSGGYRTIGEMLFKDEKFLHNKRNKDSNYSNTFGREMLCDEISLIFQKQREFENPYATAELEQAYLEIYTSQRSFEEGPGGDSPYGGNQIEKKLGKCQFEKEEFRGLKSQYSVEYSNMLQKVNSLKIGTISEKLSLSKQQRDDIIELIMTKSAVTYADLRKKLMLSDDQLFNISYGNATIAEVEKKTKLNFMETYKKIKKAYGEAFKYLSTEKLDMLGYALSVYKNDGGITDYLKANDFSKDEIAVALTMPSFSGAGHVSVAFCKKIIPFLEQGYHYDEACGMAGYSFNSTAGERSFYLPTTAEELKDLANPVVRRAIAQTIKVTNAIIRKYGESPSFVTIETARDLANNFTERRKISNSQKENQSANDRRMDTIRNDFKKYNATGMDLIKLKLWEEQDGRCAYSRKAIEREKLFEIGYVEIDHIVPYSLSFDDSYRNKVLVFTAENRQKGNRLPLQYISNREEFIVWVKNTVRDYKKRERLLKEQFAQEDENAWKERNLTDTKYISRFLFQYFRKYLEFADNQSGKKQTVMAVNGGVTSYVRKRWKIQKVRDNGDLHHAIDAVVIGCITSGMVKRIAAYSKRHELKFAENIQYDSVDKSTGELIDKFPTPYPQFSDELEMLTSKVPKQLLASYQEKFRLLNYEPDAEVEPIFVSRMPNHKITGSAHEATVRSGKLADQGYVISKVELTRLKLDADGEIADYYMPQSDRLLYNALKAKLIAHGGKGQDAFKENFFKPKSDGTQGPLVKKVKIIEKSTLTVPVYQNIGVAKNDNGSMIRVDVFKVENAGYFLVPIYVVDTLKQELPQKAIVAGSYDKWKTMDDKDFLFSLYSNDLIKITSKSKKTFSTVKKDSTMEKTFDTDEIFVYYKSTNISSASIRVITHDNTYCIDSLGVKGLLSIEKYEVDPIGNRTKVNKEKRQTFSKR